MKRYNNTEKAAIRACEYIKHEGMATFNIIWVKSHTWGLNPNVKWGNETVGRASGCGYDKESAALVDFLNFLIPEGKYLPSGGAGFNSVRRDLVNYGWNLEKTYSGKYEDGYKISKI